MPQPESATDGAPAGLRLRKLWYLLGATLLLIVAVASLLPAPEVAVSDKLSHLLVYFVLGAWFGLLASGIRALVWTALILMIYGMLLELLQATTGYRFAEWGDVMANCGGILAGATLYFTPLRRLLQRIDGWLTRRLQ